MRALILACSVLFVSAFVAIPIQCQESTSSQQPANDNAVEGSVVSSTRNTLVVRTDDNQYQLFTYDRGAVRSGSLVSGARVRVTAGPADENGTRVASNVSVVSAPSGASVDKGAQAAPVPEKIRDIESDIKRESRRWRLGVRAGAAFDPELFSFGVQSQLYPNHQCGVRVVSLAHLRNLITSPTVRALGGIQSCENHHPIEASKQ